MSMWADGFQEERRSWRHRRLLFRFLFESLLLVLLAYHICCFLIKRYTNDFQTLLLGIVFVKTTYNVRVR